jgi:secreted PhoX family phosphatase
MKDGGNFSQPDALTSAVINGVPYLIVCEDIGSGKRNRVNENAQAKGEKYNEMFFLDLTTKNPTRDNLVRFGVGPRGCELTGPIFTPDGKTMFVVVQNPNKNNVEPFNRSIVVAVTGVF